LFCVCLLAGAAAFGQEEPPPANINVTPSSLSFGSVCVGTSSPSKAFTIKNNDPDDENGNTLHVDGVTRTGSGNLAYNNPGDFNLDPQETRAVPVTFNSSLPPGNRMATFRVLSDGDDSSVPVVATGTVVHRLIAVSSSNVSFGEQRVGSRSPNKTLVVRNPGQDAVQVTSIKRLGANGGDFVATVPAAPFTIAAGDFRNITIAFQPSGGGLRKGALEIVSNGCTHPKLTVSLVGTGVLPNVAVQPNPIDAGSSPVGKPSKPTAITVSNDGQAPLKISGVQIIGADAADFALSNLPPMPKTLQPDESFVFSIRMTATEEGLRLASVNVLSDDPDGATFTIPVRGTALAAGPSPTPSASSPSPSPTASPTIGGSPRAIGGTPNDSVAIVLVVGGVLFAFVGLIVYRRFIRTPDDDF
jgi:hypothetical protein